MAGTSVNTVGRNVRLLEAFCSAGPGTNKEGHGDLCRALAGAFVSAVEALDKAASPTDWRLRHVDRAELLAGLARA